MNISNLFEITVAILSDKKPWWFFYLLQPVDKNVVLNPNRFKWECDVDFLEQCYEAEFRVKRRGK